MQLIFIYFPLNLDLWGLIIKVPQSVYETMIHQTRRNEPFTPKLKGEFACCLDVHSNIKLILTFGPNTKSTWNIQDEVL